MRVHFGFSKHIKIKTLIEILGFLFVGLMAFFGFIQHGYCWESMPLNRFTNIETTNLDKNNNFNPVTYTSNNIFIRSDSVGLDGHSDSNDLYVVGLSNFRNDVDWITQDRNYYFNNNFGSMCATSDDTLQSIDFKFLIHSTIISGDVLYIAPEFRYSLDTSMYNIYLRALDTSKGYIFNTSCTIDNIVWPRRSTPYYITQNELYVTCSNVFSGNANYNIDKFEISVLNALPFNNQYLNSSTIPPLAFTQYIMNYNFDHSANIDYQCNSEPPVLNVGFESEDDPAGLNDIYDKILDNYDDDVSGIYTITPPKVYSDLLSLPLELMEVIINSNKTTCTPFELDLSSIVSQWGSPNSNYVLTFPCMRSTLSSILGNDFYNLLDLLICFFLFYNIAMFIVRSINAVASGQDLYDFYFKTSDDSSSIGKDN